jgi:hypothetical protein
MILWSIDLGNCDCWFWKEKIVFWDLEMMWSCGIWLELSFYKCRAKVDKLFFSWTFGANCIENSVYIIMSCYWCSKQKWIILNFQSKSFHETSMMLLGWHDFLFSHFEWFTALRHGIMMLYIDVFRKVNLNSMWQLMMCWLEMTWLTDYKVFITQLHVACFL